MEKKEAGGGGRVLGRRTESGIFRAVGGKAEDHFRSKGPWENGAPLLGWGLQQEAQLARTEAAGARKDRNWLSRRTECLVK